MAARPRVRRFSGHSRGTGALSSGAESCLARRNRPLRPTHRMVLELRYHKAFSMEQVAKILGVNLSPAKNGLQLAQEVGRRLRRVLDPNRIGLSNRAFLAGDPAKVQGTRCASPDFGGSPMPVRGSTGMCRRFTLKAPLAEHSLSRIAVRRHCPRRNPWQISRRGFCLQPRDPSYDNGSHAATHHRRV